MGTPFRQPSAGTDGRSGGKGNVARLAALPSVSGVQFGRLAPGEPSRGPSLYIQIDREKLRQLGVSMSDFNKALSAFYKVQGDEPPATAADIGNRFVTSIDGRTVRLKDVAEVKDTIAIRCRTRIDGKPVIAIGLRAAPDTKPADIVQAVKDAFPRIRPICRMGFR